MTYGTYNSCFLEGLLSVGFQMAPQDMKQKESKVRHACATVPQPLSPASPPVLVSTPCAKRWYVLTQVPDPMC